MSAYKDGSEDLEVATLGKRKLVCHQCGATFEDKTDRSRKRSRAFCSLGCYHASQGLSHDKRFFSRMTPEAAYWAGFLMADGSVVGRSVSLTLRKADEDHLLKFRSQIRSEHKVTPVETKSPTGKICFASKLSLRSPSMVDDLLWWGVVPRKTYVGKIPANAIPADLMPHYMRGLFDGDGCIQIRPQWHLDLTGNMDVIEAASGIIFDACGARGTIETAWNSPVTGHMTGRLLYTTKKDVHLVATWMYSAPGPAMVRKQCVAAEIIAVPAESVTKRRLPSVDVRCLSCGIPFTVTGARYAAGRGRYCSRRCRDISRNVKSETRTCEGCGSTFDVDPRFHRTHRFCSPRCYYDRNLPDQNALLEILQENTTRRAAGILGISKSHVSHVAKRVGIIHRPGKGWMREEQPQ